MKFYAADDDERRYRSNELVGDFAAFQLPTIATWHGVTEGRQKADEPMSRARLTTRGLNGPTQLEVEPLMPIEFDWLEVPGPEIRTIPAGRGRV